MESASNLSGYLFGTQSVQGPTQTGQTLDVATGKTATPGLFNTYGKLSFDNLDALLANGSTFASAAATLKGGFDQAKATKIDAAYKSSALEMQAREQELAAKQEETRGRQEANTILDNMVQTIAAQRLAFASQGTDIGFGTPVSITESSRDLANLQLSTSRNDALMRVLTRRRQSYALRADAGNVMTSGSLTAKGQRSVATTAAGKILYDSKERSDRRG